MDIPGNSSTRKNDVDKTARHPENTDRNLTAEITSRLPSTVPLKTTLFDLAKDSLTQRSKISGEPRDQDSIYRELNRVMDRNGYPDAKLEHRIHISDKNLPAAWNNVSHGQSFNLYDEVRATQPKPRISAPQVSEDARNRLNKLILNETTTLPLQPGEGYFQVLKRMHPDVADERVSQDAQRIKAINHFRDVLQVGERLPTATEDQRRRELERRLARSSPQDLPSANSAPIAPTGTKVPEKTTPAEPPTLSKTAPSEPAVIPPQPPSAQATEPGAPAVDNMTMTAAYTTLKSSYEQLQNTWSRETHSQGFIGKSFDAAKNHIGASSDGTSWYDPRRLWSGLFDSKLGSANVSDRLNQEGQQLIDLKRAVDTNDQASFRRGYKSLTGVDFDPTQKQAAPLSGNQLVVEYDRSQKSGVDTTTDIASGLASVVSLRVKGAGSLSTLAKVSVASALLSGSTKAALMQADGKYANLPRDFATGSLMGLAVPISELAGAKTSRFAGGKMNLTVTGDFLTARIETQGVGVRTRVLSAALKSGTSGAVFGAIESPSREIVENVGTGKPIAPLNLAGLSLKGAAFGFLGGTVLGGVSDRVADFLHGAFPGKVTMQNATVGGVEVPLSGTVGLESASKILKIKPEDLIAKATTDPYGAVKNAVQLYEQTGLNIQKVDPLTGHQTLPKQFAETLATVQNVELLTAESGVKLAKKVEVVQSAEAYLKANPREIEGPFAKVTSEPSYQEVVRLKGATTAGSADAFEQQFKREFESDLKTTMAVKRIKHHSLSESEAASLSAAETEAAYKQKAAEFFKDMTDPLQRERLNTLVDEIHVKFNPEIVSKVQLSDILKNFSAQDRPLAVALMQESAGSSSDTALTAKLRSLRSDIQAATGSSSPDNVFTLAPNSSGNLIGYLYRKSNSMSMSINNIDKLAERVKSGQIPNSIVLFDDISSASIPAATKDLLKKIPKVYVVDLGAFEKGINVLDFSKGPQTVQNKLEALMAEARANQAANPGLLPTGVARQTLSSAVDDAAQALGSNVQIIRPTGNPKSTAGAAAASQAASSDIDQLYSQLNIPKTSKEEIAGFLSNYAGQERELAARMIADGAVHNSFPVMVKKAVQLHDKLDKMLQKQGLSMKDVVMVSDKDPGGSTHLVTYLFGSANGLPEANFVSSNQLDALLSSGGAKNKVIAYFDDTIYSGSQTSNMLDSNISSLSPFKRIVVAGLGAYEKGVDRIQSTHLGKLGKVDVATPNIHHPFYSDQHPFYAQLAKPQQNLVKTIGGSDGFGTIQGSLIWPYMYPDNNITFFGSQFAGSVLHLPGP